MKYKVGDKVRVRQWEDLKSQYETDEYGEINVGVIFIEDMKNFCGKELVIEGFNYEGYAYESNGWSWQDWMFEDVETKTIRIDEKREVKIVRNHELVIKTRQLDELMKFIAHLVPKAHKEYLSHHLNDVQLIDGIMYHVRKGE